MKTEGAWVLDFGAIRREETVGTTALCIACRVCVGAVVGVG